MGVRQDKSIFRRALEISLLLHLLLIFLVAPSVVRVWPTSDASAVELAPQVPPSDQPPLEFEFVDLAEDREETPVSDQVPLSDLDRRAHGGEGEAAERPTVTGNTPQLVQADGAETFGAGSPPQLQGRPVPQVPPPERPQEEPLEDPLEQRPTEPDVEGAGEEAPEPEAQQPALQLPPPGAWALPPDQGGLPEMPDRDDGGSVDTGGLSFDTQWYDWGPYAKAMLAKIRRHWRRLPCWVSRAGSGFASISNRTEPSPASVSWTSRANRRWTSQPETPSPIRHPSNRCLWPSAVRSERVLPSLSSITPVVPHETGVDDIEIH